MQSKEIDDGEELLQELKTMFYLSKGALRNILRNMNDAMTQGLLNEGGFNGIKMIPTFVNKFNRTYNEEGQFLGVDFGATNFGICLLILKEGKIIDSHSIKHVLPKEKKQGTGEELFDYCAQLIKKVLEEDWKDLNIDTKSIITTTLAFSFPVHQTNLSSGILIKWTKEFTVSGVQGQDVVALFNLSLQKFELGFKIHYLINNTVGTLISRYFDDPDCSAGCIVGTGIKYIYINIFFLKILIYLGSNLCYWEHLSSIPKISIDSTNYSILESSSQMMLINTEWGGYNDIQTISLTPFDKQLDEESSSPGDQLYEKMISGRYIGELCRIILLYLMKKKAIRFISNNFKNKYSLKAEHLSLILADNSERLIIIDEFLNKEFDFDSLLEERQRIRAVCDIVVKRAGRLAAAGIGAVTYRMGTVSKTLIAVDGAVYEQMEPFRNAISTALQGIYSLFFSKYSFTFFIFF